MKPTRVDWLRLGMDRSPGGHVWACCLDNGVLHAIPMATGSLWQVSVRTGGNWGDGDREDSSRLWCRDAAAAHGLCADLLHLAHHFAADPREPA